MIKTSFFKPTPLYKEFMILDIVSKDPKVTQRELARLANASVSMINTYLDEYEAKGYLSREYLSTKFVNYYITKKGIERKQYLNIGYLNASQQIHQYAKQNIVMFLSQIITRGFKKIMLYGAGEVAEIMLQTISDDIKIPISIEAVIDDEVSKQGKNIINTLIVGPNDISNYEHDGILISSYTNNDLIYKRLIELNYDKDKILHFFENKN